ncbi:bZIP transcription factor [Aspergillus clavatus NRRL 1]|uniref:BZIP transcription factor, putative n=1 Tax=Aspergillus clavatus (strain ATCC 1007 / CBS 513.65 / DSM 816 / NCTC 3887 / NRRL 1 / QM 1276 / 107) TaxID=344612 RepID=A1CT42_ASPCL|nr:bZIP transcription factor, putative [Aspergillus clavatus NRRL 1]EAW06479.1 bZIP transcription factor, putative [Aspergillus clavatus NRRL 1]
MSDELQQQNLARQVAASNVERLENFNFLLSRHDPAVTKSRQYSFDADSTTLASFQNLNMEYDQTEGMGGLSVSSYDSIDDDRSPIDVRGYPYHGDKSINYSLPDQMLSYPAHPIYPPISYGADEFSHPPGAMTPSDVSSSISPPNGQVGNTKYSTPIAGDSIASALGQEEDLRRAAEEDRRRRNTAASARFRMKKKQREQVLERTVRETTEKNATLEARVAQLEMENRWLKNLLTEKHDTSSTRMAPPAAAGSEGSSALTQKKGNGVTGSGQKHIQPKKKGVGTEH